MISIVNIIVVILFAVYRTSDFTTSLPAWFPNARNEFLLYDYFIFCLLSIVGALLGNYLSNAGGYNMTRSVQWGTFRVNMMSCIIIGTINNLTLFGSSLTESEYISIVFYRFVVGFCGSFSSFGGLMDETIILFHNKVWKRRRNCFRNLFYNLFVCIGVYLIVILSVRVAVFFRYWSPDSAVFLCGKEDIFSCFIF